MPAGTVLFSSRAPIGYIAVSTDEVATNQGFKSVIPNGIPNSDIGTAFVYCFLVRNKGRIADAGSSTTFPEASGKTMREIGLTVPDKSQCAVFSRWADQIFGQQRLLEDECHVLEQLRDNLLPKLMSGEIDVSEIPSLIEQVRVRSRPGCREDEPLAVDGTDKKPVGLATALPEAHAVPRESVVAVSGVKRAALARPVEYVFERRQIVITLLIRL